MRIRKEVYKYLLEIVSIFIGITLSFAFEEFRQSRDERSKRKEIIRSLIADIDFKANEIRNDKEAIIWQYTTIDSCLWFADNAKEVPKRLIRDLHSVSAADFSHFEPTTPSFLSLTSTGIWQQLPDTLRRRIYNSYNGDFTLLTMMYHKAADYSSFIQQHYLVARSLMKPLNNDPDFASTRKALADPQFRSALLLFRNQNENTIHPLDRSLRHLQRLSASLKVYDKEN